MLSSSAVSSAWSAPTGATRFHRATSLETGSPRARATSAAQRLPHPVGRWAVLALVVDDDHLSRLVAKAALEYFGVRVVTADNGVEALSLVWQQRFQIVFMDHRMPHMDGLDATRRIRGAERDRQMPVVALTASCMADEQQACRDAGMDDVLLKPLDFAELHGVLRHWLGYGAGAMVG